MVVSLWKLRSRYSQPPDLDREYGGVGFFFTLKFHHKGIFTVNTGRRYVDGVVDYIDYVDMDMFSIHELNAMLEELGYKEGGLPLYNYFRIPGTTLEIGLLPLGNDSDVHVLGKYARENNLIDIYIEHGISRVRNYLMSPSKVVIEDIQDVEVNEQQGNVIEPMLQVPLMVDNVEEPGSPPHNLRIMPYIPVRADKGVGKNAYFVDVQHIDDQARVDMEGDALSEQNPIITNANDFSEFNPFEGFSDWDNGAGDTSDHVGGSSTHVGETSGKDAYFNTCDMHESDDSSDSDESTDIDKSDLLYDKNNILEEPEIDMSEFVSVAEQHFERDPSTIPINPHIADLEDELCVIDNTVFDTQLEEMGEMQEKRKQLLKNITKPVVCSEGEVHLPAFRLGQTFKTKDDVRELVDLHSIHTKRALYWDKNDKERIRIKCKGVVPDLRQCGPWTKNKIKCKTQVVKSKTNICPWVLFISRQSQEVDWMVKTVVADHNCVQSRKIKACTADYMGKQLVSQLESNPTIPVDAVHEDLQKKFGVGFSRMKAFRAKQVAEKLLYGDFEKQYTVLREYGLELQKCNEGTTFKIEVEHAPNYASDTRVFKRVYVCLGCLKLGFKAGIRDFIGVDGAFIKGPYSGQLLTAVGLDSNNGIYPVAYAIVEVESKDSWSWFLQCLGDDLGLDARSNFTFNSDRQKGIIPAIKEVFPNAEHRFCLRHIHQNMRTKWRDTEYRDHLWNIATATTERHFDAQMELFRQFDANAHAYLSKIKAKHWSKAHFSGRAKTDSLTNNLCEVFNSKLLKARDKPIITCLEYTREYLMRRHVIVQKEIDKCKEKCQPLTPTATTILDAIKKEATQNTCIFNGRDKTQVTTAAKEQYVVNLNAKTCTCRYLELTGIVCSHAVSAIWDKINHGAKHVPIIEEWVHPIYWVDTWVAMYTNKVDPVNGRSMWPKSDCPTKLTAPKHHVQVGRPKKKRRKSEGEDVVNNGNNLTRKFISLKCGKCGNLGHNKRTCKGQGGQGGQAGQGNQQNKRKAPAKKAPTTAPVNTAPTTAPSTAPVNNPPAKKGPAKKASAKNAPAKKAAAKKAAAKKLF